MYRQAWRGAMTGVKHGVAKKSSYSVAYAQSSKFAFQYQKNEPWLRVTTIDGHAIRLVRTLVRKYPPKWRKCESFRGNCLCVWRPERVMDRMDQPRTSLDERKLSGRRAVVIV